MGRSARKRFTRNVWWTRERVIDALRRFYAEFHHAPLSTAAYQDCVTGIGVNRCGSGNRYPSFYGVLKHFRSFRDAWREIGIAVDRIHEDWTAEEDALISRNAGLISRNSLAQLVHRTPNAVHRRLYDLGINSRTAQGWSINRVSKATGVPDWIIQRWYVKTKKLHYIRGIQCLYLDPGDLCVIKEIDWKNASSELTEAIRRSLMARLVRVIETATRLREVDTLSQNAPRSLSQQNKERKEKAEKMRESDNNLLTIIANTARRCGCCGRAWSGFEIAETAATECKGAGNIFTTIQREYRPAAFDFCPGCGSGIKDGISLPLFDGLTSPSPPSSNGDKPLFKSGKVYNVTDAVKIIGANNRALLTEAYRTKQIPFDTSGNSKFFRGEDLESWWAKQGKQQV